MSQVKNLYKNVLYLALVFLLSLQANSADNLKDSSSKVTQKVKVRSPNSKTSNDIDKEITNKKLRADLGSKSKFSLTLTGTFSGGSISQPFGKVRPNIYGNTEQSGTASARAELSMRYRFTKRGSLAAGAGMLFARPFREDSNTSVSDPFINYTLGYKFLKLQAFSQAEVKFGTSTFTKSRQKLATYSYTQVLSSDFGGSKFTFGSFGFIEGYAYSDDINSYSPTQLAHDDRLSYSLAFYPFMEYQLSQKVSLRTVLGLFGFSHERRDSSQSLFDMQADKAYQSLGLGISASRDIYIYPNIQFSPDNINSKDSNFGISLTMNSF